MQVNKNLSQEIYQDAGEARTIKAKRYINQGKVNIIRTNYEDQNNFSITSRFHLCRCISTDLEGVYQGTTTNTK